MRRMTVHVHERTGSGDTVVGWRVSVRTAGADAAPVDVVEPYDMDMVTVGRRRVPTTPPERRPADGEPHAPMCAGDTGAITTLLNGIHYRQDQADVGCYGRWLFECVLAPAWQAIRQHPDVARGRAVEIALRWPVNAVDLHRLVWEAMHDSTAPLAGYPTMVVAITRLVPGPAPEVRTITGIPRVLFATSVELTDPTIRPGAMFMGLLRGFDASGRCRARAVQGVSVDDLRKHCADFTPDIVHIVAHGELLGDGRGALMLRDDVDQYGAEKECDAAALTAALTAAGIHPQTVILSACNTASPGESRDADTDDPTDDPTNAAPLAAQLVAAGIPIVAAMAGEVSEAACRLYTRRLADAVHEGQPITAASAHGRRAALVANGTNGSIDWALPALFLTEQLDPAVPLVDSTRVKAIVGLANELRLRREPVFIGRQDLLDTVDRAMDPDEQIGVVAALSRESTSQLGGTRLLQEIGWRLLRDGHVPVLLGPYPDKPVPTISARGLVYEILKQIVMITEKLGLAPTVPMTLHESLEAGEFQNLVAEVATGHPTVARRQVRRRLVQFGANKAVLDADDVRDLLAEDLAILADQVTEWGAPFGPHTRTVLLCDDVHAWAEPSGGLTNGLHFLLKMLTASGLGRPGRHMPVVLTGSKLADSGRVLDEWSSNTQPGFLAPPLDELAADDAVLGYQWVLLHPWTTKPPAENCRFSHVYTAEPAGTMRWEKALREVGGKPASVERDLYLVAASSAASLICRRDNDEQAWRAYAEENRL